MIRKLIDKFVRPPNAPVPVAPPIGRGSVVTPAVPQKPTGLYWDQLEAADSLQDLYKLREIANAHSYGPEGQLQRAITEKIDRFARR